MTFSFVFATAITAVVVFTTAANVRQPIGGAPAISLG